MEESDAGIFQPALCSPKRFQRRCGGYCRAAKALAAFGAGIRGPASEQQVPLPDLHEPETMKALYQGRGKLSRIGKGNKKTALSDGKEKALLIKAEPNRDTQNQISDMNRHKLPLVHTSEMTLDYSFLSDSRNFFV